MQPADVLYLKVHSLIVPTDSGGPGHLPGFPQILRRGRGPMLNMVTKHLLHRPMDLLLYLLYRTKRALTYFTSYLGQYCSYYFDSWTQGWRMTQTQYSGHLLSHLAVSWHNKNKQMPNPYMSGRSWVQSLVWSSSFQNLIGYGPCACMHCCMCLFGLDWIFGLVWHCLALFGLGNLILITMFTH